MTIRVRPKDVEWTLVAETQGYKPKCNPLVVGPHCGLCVVGSGRSSTISNRGKFSNLSALGDVNTPCSLTNVYLLNLLCGVVRHRWCDNNLLTYSDIWHWIYAIDACGILNNTSNIWIVELTVSAKCKQGV